LKGEYQKDVYTLAKLFLRNMALEMGVSGKQLNVIDVGCGSGWKLVHLIARKLSLLDFSLWVMGQFKTLGGYEISPNCKFA